MLIEADARRFIVQAIEGDKELTTVEEKEKSKGKIVIDNKEFLQCRAKLAKTLSQINSVGNPEGTGRDDLGIEILEAAEGVSRRIS
jgi:hypothetical protein